jgi:NitT/TauT family transport system substrate-binding protein
MNAKAPTPPAGLYRCAPAAHGTGRGEQAGGRVPAGMSQSILEREEPAMARRFTRAVRAVEVLGAVAAVAVLAIIFLTRPTGAGEATSSAIEQPDLNVAVVPAADSAGFFVALHEGLFAARGLHVTFIPAVSSETVINAQALDEPSDRIDISCGNYVSYIQAQENYDQGKRPSSTTDSMVAADLDIFAEGSVMEPGAQGLYVMPDSPIRTLAGLEGKTIGVNAPGNILYLLAASVLADHGLSVSGARFAYYPLPEMAAMLKAGKIAAAVLPEPFASQAEQSMGVTVLADLDQGATAAFPVQGCAVTRQWAALHPVTLAAFRAAFEQGQEIADTNRTAVERAMEALPAPLGLSRGTAAVMALDSYPVGPVDPVRVQRVADVMREFLGFPAFDVRSMISG